MNDCFWCFINGVCDYNNCANCKEYISVNSERGMELYERYDADVEEALKPVAKKWKQLKENKDEFN